jgi:hypothetical protein
MNSTKKEIHRRAQRTFRTAAWKSDKLLEKHELKMLRKERKLRWRVARRRELKYGE